jgi:hypothetical protein
MEVDGSGSGSCPVLGFSIGSVEPSSSAIVGPANQTGYIILRVGYLAD